MGRVSKYRRVLTILCGLATAPFTAHGSSTTTIDLAKFESKALAEIRALASEPDALADRGVIYFEDGYKARPGRYCYDNSQIFYFLPFKSGVKTIDSNRFRYGPAEIGYFYSLAFGTAASWTEGSWGTRSILGTLSLGTALDADGNPIKKGYLNRLQYYLGAGVSGVTFYFASSALGRDMRASHEAIVARYPGIENSISTQTGSWLSPYMSFKATQSQLFQILMEEKGSALINSTSLHFQASAGGGGVIGFGSTYLELGESELGFQGKVDINSLRTISKTVDGCEGTPFTNSAFVPLDLR